MPINAVAEVSSRKVQMVCEGMMLTKVQVVDRILNMAFKTAIESTPEIFREELIIDYIGNIIRYG